MFPDTTLPTEASALLPLLKTVEEKHWLRRGDELVLKLFREMADRVPAYKDFLRKNSIDPSQIRSLEDLERVPVTNKDNYLLAYPLEQLCWDGKLEGQSWTIASTSGSTGEPFYFPRTQFQDQQFRLTAELMLVDIFEIDKKRTLFIDCFALGVWIGGMFMYQAIKYLMDSGKYPLSIITPGADKTESLKAVKNLAPKFEQIIIGGYAPLVKDLIDDGIRLGINWDDYNVRYFFAAEGFTEGYRDYILKKGGAKNIFTDTINHYGTADLGTMANETPLSILIRRLATNNPAIATALFDEPHKQPTLTQFIPELFYFERIGNRVACSGCGGLPLVRYDLKDRGGILTFEDMHERLKAQGIDLREEALRAGISDKVWQLPFVYLFERDDLTASIYSVNIYPQSIRKALQHPDLEDRLTGKFSMVVDYDEHQNQYLQINLELQSGAAEDEQLRERALASIITILNEENSEWRDFYADAGIRHKVTPALVFWGYQDPTHFKAGAKQKWVKKLNGTQATTMANTISMNTSVADDDPIILREGEHSLADVEGFKKEHKIWKEVDVFEIQQKELFEITHPSLIFSENFDQQRDAYAAIQVKEAQQKLSGSYVYYPWSGVFVHTVSEFNYKRLRTNRNRNLITEDEQALLSGATVGIIGLSVGSNVAAALTYAGIANNLKLAEFDTLETTNLNRVRATLPQIGMTKIDLLRQQLYEIDPFLNIHTFQAKLDTKNLTEFITGNPRPRVIFEIIDSFEMKVHIRAMARQHGIPVIMVTNLGDRVLMDVERYDLDRNIEYFNGRAGKVPHDMLENPDVTTEDKHRYAVDLAGVQNIPQRAMDSVAEIGKTLVGRPQLASTVIIAGGFGAYLTKQIILGRPLPSNSWLVDLEKVFSPEQAL